MLKSLTIKNFRCFQHFELQQLGRINLLVGENNSGKTSILEALQLLELPSHPESLQSIMMGRGEYTFSDDHQGRDYQLDICHLFNNHELQIGEKFSIIAKTHNSIEGVRVSIEESMQLDLFGETQDITLVITDLGEKDKPIQHSLTSDGSLSRRRLRNIRQDLKQAKTLTQFIAASSFSTEKMFELFDQVVLTSEEDLVIKALQTIEPDIQRIASIGVKKYRYTDSKTGFVIKLTQREKRIPIGSMGDGIWRILGLALAIINAKDGILLVDEIDTGLHFSAMSDMWKLVWETAQRLNVQVFATTHNSDCWTSLAELANRENPSEEGITIQRIEKGKSKSVVFTEQQVAIAAERGIEVR